MSVNVTSKSLSQDDTHPDDHSLCTYYCSVYDMTPGFKPFTFNILYHYYYCIYVRQWKNISFLALRTPIILCTQYIVSTVHVGYFLKLHNFGDI